jgi:hypothetical protein
VHSGKNLIIIIDTDQLLTEQEAENLKQMAEEMQG